MAKVWISIFSLIILSSCVEKELDPNNPQKSFIIAKEPYDDENYEIALSKLGEFKTRFPYSSLSREAELLMANCHFELENYAEATASYEQFVKLHPKHPKVDFALFRVGQSYWEDAPEEIDREQELTGKAIEEWARLVEEYPQSKYTAKAKQLVAEGSKRIALANEFAAAFYCKQEIWHACAYRYVWIWEKYKNYPPLAKKAGLAAAEALENLARQKQELGESDKNLYYKRMSPDQLREMAARFRKSAEAIQVK